MKRYVIVGILVFVGFAAAFAPAGILDRAVDGIEGIDLLEARGTVWRGAARLMAHGELQGDLTWDFQASSLMELAPGYAWTLNDELRSLLGAVHYRDGAAELSMQGTLQADLFNPWLDRYDIYLTGMFDVLPSAVTIENGQPPTLTAATGQIHWTGGLVRYTLSGQLREATVPELVAHLETKEGGGARATVLAMNDRTPLLVAEQSDGGYVKVSITKYFTKLLNNPWPGSDPDHAVVLEVEEQLF